ncbi:MAG: TetR/AcrR family transcriptional regulator [Clostridiales bacterium]|nr:TetR/AcrR family transcriptional regulator [Clostridiales bacterium]
MPKDTFLNLPDGKKNKIITAAVDEFGRKPYEKASINQIVKKSGISKGSIYQYFDNKEDLYRYIINLMISEKTNFISSKADITKDSDFFSKIRELYKSGLEFASANPAYINIVNMLLKDSHSPLFNEIVQENIHMSYETFEFILRQGIENGEIRDDINLKIISHIFSEMNMWILDYYRKNISNESDDEILTILDDFLDFLRNGIIKNAEKI